LVDEIAAGLCHLGGTRIDGVDQVPASFIAGHRKQPTGRPAGRPKGAKASYKRAPYRKKEEIYSDSVDGIIVEREDRPTIRRVTSAWLAASKGNLG
jgi:hypothetical protein